MIEDTKQIEKKLARQMRKVLNLRLQLSVQFSHLSGDLSRRALNSWDVTTIDQSQLLREAGKLDGMIEMVEEVLAEAGMSNEEIKAVLDRAEESARND